MYNYNVSGGQKQGKQGKQPQCKLMHETTETEHVEAFGSCSKQCSSKGRCGTAFLNAKHLQVC